MKIFVICFHEITLAGNLLNSLGVAFEFIQLAGISLVLLCILVDFTFKVADLHFQLKAFQKAVLVNQAYNEHANDTHYKVFIVRNETQDNIQTTCHN